MKASGAVLNPILALKYGEGPRILDIITFCPLDNVGAIAVGTLQTSDKGLIRPSLVNPVVDG